MSGWYGNLRLCTLAAAVPMLFPVSAAAEQELVVLNWKGYMAPELVERFEQSRGVHVTDVYFQSDDLRDAMMIETDGAGYDLTVVNGASLPAYVARGWLARVDRARVPNLHHVDPKWMHAAPGAGDYGVPYFWGLIGIAYHADKLPRTIDHWMDLLRPAPELQHRIAMIQNAREVTAVALLALGYDPNTTLTEEIRAAGSLLAEQRPFVRTYEYMDLSHEGLRKGEVLAGLIYSGDWIGLHAQHPEIAYVVPEEGSVRWVDYMTVPSASHVQFPSPNRAADARLPASARNDPVRNPTAAVLARCRLLEPAPPASLRLINNFFVRLSD
jgi:spermidine/putrescine transport system substrate-binding protein